MPSSQKQKTPLPAFTFYARPRYYSELASMISKTKGGDRVSIATMSFKPAEPPIQRIMQELQAAARRGVDVNLLVDAFPFMISDGMIPGPLLFTRQLPQRLPKNFRVRLDALNNLQAQGGHYTIINWPLHRFTNPFAGRSHIKFAVVNDYVFVGGCNLTKVDHLDLMAGWEDPRTASWLIDFAQNVAKSGSVIKTLRAQDLKLSIDSATTLLIDAGKSDQSLILDKALSLIDAAQEHILITCQYFPNNITARHLAAAQDRGVSVKIIYNHPSKHPLPLNLLHHSVLLFEKLNKPCQLFAHQLPKNHDFLHAKLLITDQGALIGSHNYVRAGTKFGTAEIALLSSDRHFGELSIRALESQLRPNL